MYMYYNELYITNYISYTNDNNNNNNSIVSLM